MFGQEETSEIIRFINSFRNDESKHFNLKYKEAVSELETRSPLLALPYKLPKN